MAERPTGFVARCRCGNYTGALDLHRSERSETSRILGSWLFDGKTVEPRFGGTWSQSLMPCQCSAPSEGQSNG